MFSLTCITMTTLSRATKRHSGVLLCCSFTLFCNFHENLDQGVSGCLARTRRGQSQQMRSSEAFLHELLRSLCQKCVIQQCLLWIYLIHLFDVLVCADLY